MILPPKQQETDVKTEPRALTPAEMDAVSGGFLPTELMKAAFAIAQLGLPVHEPEKTVTGKC
jgi:hypothetical protein